MKVFLFAAVSFFSLAVITVSCSKDDIPEIEGNMPKCVKRKIEQSYKKRNMPISVVYRYHYEGREVYYILQDCNDCFSELISKDCTFMCSPDGGFAGGGDGNCTDFFDKATDRTLVWKKP